MQEKQPRSSEMARWVYRRVITSIGVLAMGLTLSCDSNAQTDTDTPPVYPSIRNYVALGDSISSGEGNEPYLPGSDIAGHNECHRSAQAFPNLVAKALHTNVKLMACSGATVLDVQSGTWNESSQLNALNQDTDLVTITVGANKISIGHVVEQCRTVGCGPDSQIYRQSKQQISTENPQEIQQLISEVTKRAPKARVLVVGYADLFDNSFVRSIAKVRIGGDSVEVEQMLIEELNNSSRQAVTATNNPRVVYVNPPHIGTDFYTSSDPNNPARVFHPTPDGQAKYAQVVLQQLAVKTDANSRVPMG